jgi:hypothetical protein
MEVKRKEIMNNRLIIDQYPVFTPKIDSFTSIIWRLVPAWIHLPHNIQKHDQPFTYQLHLPKKKIFYPGIFFPEETIRAAGSALV